MCGEKISGTMQTTMQKGSPPHVRGKDAARKEKGLLRGITPACAGKSSMLSGAITSLLDHPRMCGEKPRISESLPPVRGSPPHVRGKENGVWNRRLLDGITPACAGKRLKRSRSTVPPVAIVPLFPSVCNKPVASDGSPAGRDAPLFLPAENAVPASPAYNLRSL